jgi:RNA polymerase sigma factor (sigma-70 family)
MGLGRRGIMQQSDTAEDQQLCEAYVRRGDQGAFAQIVDRHAHWIFAAALRQLHDRELAEDAVQIVFVILAQKAHTMDTRQKLSGWLFNTLQFTVKNFRRAERSRRRHEANAAKPVIQELPPDPAMVRELAEQIDAAVAQLRTPYREALLLRFHQDLPLDQVARILGTTEAAARKRVDRGLDALRRNLGSTACAPSMVSAAAMYGFDQSPPSLAVTTAKTALAARNTGMLAPALNTGVKQVAYHMAMTKALVAALVACGCLIVVVPVTVIGWRAISQTMASIQPSATPKSLAATANPIATIGGIVRNEAGQPLDGVHVHLEWQTTVPGKDGGPPQPAFGTRDLLTDADGRWRCSSPRLVDASDFSVRLQRTGYGSDDDAAPIKGNLTDQTAEFVMTRGIQVSGMVVDQSGSPIRGAKVSTIEVRYVVNDPGKTVATDASGHFVFPPQAAGTIALTTTARSYGPDLQRVSVADGMSPIRIVLSPGKMIRGRIVDQNGQPVEAAMVRAFRWRNMNSLQWTGQTNRDGRFIMRDAPDDAIEFEVFKDGYQALINTSLTSGEGETTVTMSSEPMVRGTVTDSDTGQPIPRFEIISGIALWAGRPPLFEFGEAKEFSDGTFEMPISGHNAVVGYYLRVEADGYSPAITAPFLTSTTFNVVLRRGQDLSGHVMGPNGKPVGGAQVILAFPGSQVELLDNHLSRTDEVRVTETDSGGEFHFGPQSGKFHLLALCDSGYALEIFDQEPREPVELKISSWAKIDGSFSTGNAARKSSRLIAAINQVQSFRDNYLHYEFQYSATGIAGRFKIEKVPSFDGGLVQLGIFPGFHGGVYERRWIPMRLTPGQTAQPDLRGATVIGILTPVDGESIRTGGFRLTPLLETPARNWPVDPSKEIKLPSPLYDFEGADHFKITGVLPGKYLYEAVFGEKPNYFRASGDLEVRTEDIDTTIDLGKLTCRPIRPIEIGQPAPDVLGHTLDETPIALRDFAGKFVVGVMWDSDPRESETPLPLLEDFGKEFAGNPHVALLGLSLDANDSANGIIVSRPGTLAYPGWMNGYVSQRDRALIFELVRDRPSIFIIGPDGKLLARDVPPKEMAATLKGLMAKQN